MAKIEVIYGVWGFGATEDVEGTVLEGGVQEIEVTKENAPYLAGGAAGAEPAIRILEVSDAEAKLLEGHVQSQEDGEAAYEAAQASGEWRKGQLLQFSHDTEHILGLPDEESNLTDGDREWLTKGLADAYEEMGDADKAAATRKRLVSTDDGEEG